MARIKKAAAPSRDNPLLERIEITARQPGLVGFTVNREGLEAIRTELRDSKLFGYAVFCVLPQRERVRAWWDMRDLDDYLSKFRLKL